MMHGLALDCVDIGYRTGGRCRIVVGGVSARLEAGRLACLVGRNGCGKSTLLRTLAGLQSPLGGGDVWVDGERLSALSPTDVARRIGLVLTQRPELQQSTVRDLVTLGRLPLTGALGITTAADRAAVERAMHLVGIAELADRRTSTLSDGEWQKAVVAKALAQGTEVLLLDEPSAFLDFVARRALMELLRTLAHEEGKAVLLSTHDLDLLPLADEVWWIEDGKLRVQGREELVISSE